MENNIKNKMKKKLFKILQNKLLNVITGNLGKVELYDDKIICYVNNNSLKKYKKGKYLPFYELIFKSKKVYPEETLNTYKVNKPIYYIIENMNFDETLCLMAPEDISLHFKNCKFNNQINILGAKNIIFENNKYYDHSPCYVEKTNCFLYVHTNNITFVNDNFVNSDVNHHPTKFGMKLAIENLEIINSVFDMKSNDGKIWISANQVDIKNSDIECYKPIYIKSDEINTDDCLIKSKTEITIENKNNSELLGFTSPKTIYNGVDLSGYICITPHTFKLQKERVSLIEKLRELRDNCININLNKLEEVENKLNQRSIGQITKKHNM